MASNRAKSGVESPPIFTDPSTSVLTGPSPSVFSTSSSVFTGPSPSVFSTSSSVFTDPSPSSISRGPHSNYDKSLESVQHHQPSRVQATLGDLDLSPWVCVLCPARRKYATRGSLKLHISNSHVSRQFHYCCVAGCNWYSYRKDKVFEHLRSEHFNNPECLSNGLVRSEDAPPPTTCPICNVQTKSWDNYFSCISSHCYFPEGDGQDGHMNMEEASRPHPQYIAPAELALPTNDGQAHRRNSRKRPNSWETEPTADRNIPPTWLNRNDGTVPQAMPDHATSLYVYNEREEGEGHRSKRAKKEPTSAHAYASSQSSLDSDHLQISQKTGEIWSTSKGEGSSAAASIQTGITTPEFGADTSIDASITLPNDLSCVLDATSHYKDLDQLELETAQMCGINGNLGLQDKHYSLLDCGNSLIRTWEALNHLRSAGFCGPLMSVLVEDPSQPGVASAVHISWNEIYSLAESLFSPPESIADTPALAFVRKLQGEECPPKPSENWNQWMPELNFLCTALSVGLLSFSGSHVCRFDINITGQPMEEIPVGLGYSFSLQKLACLDNFIGGPAWILGKSDPRQINREMRVSLTVQDLQELWGPVWIMGSSPDKGRAIRTERGYVVPLAQQFSTTRGIECHWMKELPQSLVTQENQPLLDTTSRLLIGTDASELGLTVNHRCQLDISQIQQQMACQLQLPGASRAQFIDDGYEVSLTGGQYVTAGFTKKWKRMPARTQRSALIELCTKSNTHLVPLLKLRVGLEISACTRNAQRVTLWEALRLSQTTAKGLSGISPSASPCEHKIGDMDCISSCWSRCRSTDNGIDALDNFSLGQGGLKVAEARRLIINSILALEHTRVDGEGNMQAWWPFSDSPLTCRLSPATAGESNNWFRVVKDTRDTSTFAVLSQRCLDAGVVCTRGCSSLCKSGDGARMLRTALYTSFLSPTMDLAFLEVGDKFLVNDTHLAVKKPPMAYPMGPIVAAVSKNPLRHKFERFLRWKDCACSRAGRSRCPGRVNHSGAGLLTTGVAGCCLACRACYRLPLWQSVVMMTVLSVWQRVCVFIRSILTSVNCINADLRLISLRFEFVYQRLQKASPTIVIPIITSVRHRYTPA